MAIPNFQQQSLQAMQMGGQLGSALRSAQAMEEQRQFQSQLRPMLLEQQQLSNQATQQDNTRKSLIQDAVLLNSMDEESGKQVIPQLVEKYKDNPEIVAGFNDLYKKTGTDYLAANIQALSLLTGKPIGGKQPKDDRTATQKEFSQYLQLKQTDPSAAAEFGRAAGFLSDRTKRLFQVKVNADGTSTKYYSDGTEETVSAKTKVKTPDMKKAMTGDQAIRIIDKAKEGQLKNAGFALTLNDGLEQTRSLVDKGYDPANAAWVTKYLEGTTLGNLLLDEQDQLFLGSVEQMINAIARRETGAAITEFERKDFFQRYLPMPGDSRERQAQKQKALERQFKSIKGQAGSVYDAIRLTQFGEQPSALERQPTVTPMQSVAPQQQPASSAGVQVPEIGAESGGYRFLGGDPSLESSWEKV